MNEIMNEDLKSSEPLAQPLTRWADLTMHTLRMVVAYDPDTQSKRLCLLGPLSLAQRRVLAREDFYEERGLLFRDELNFGLTQLTAIFPYVRAVNKHASDIGVLAAELPALQQELKKMAALRPTIVTTASSAENLLQVPLSRPVLSIEPVPFSSRFSSVRSYLGHAEFNRLKKAVFIRAGYRCEICLENGFEQGHQHPVECHEVFEYDELKGTQKITALMSLCPRCHSVKNIELSRAKSDDEFEAAMAQLARINGWSKPQAQTYYQHALHVWKERSKKSWELNLDMLDGTGLQFPGEDNQTVKRPKRGREIGAKLPFLSQLPLNSMKLFSTAGMPGEA
ncbi:HNH endonuclease [Undibacterium sp. Ji42W]|uniref:HNH endonuclease n=1 Tax=Undibacterium sp. Ji42W TaxID=3413039 RepID=UPI003BF00BD6